MNISFEYGSTIDDDFIKRSKRKRKVKSLLNNIKKYDLVITDRLHGVILSYDVGVPCIALDNNTGKVQSVASMLEPSHIVHSIKRLSSEKIHEIIKLLEITEENPLDYKKKYNVLLKEFSLN